MADIRPVQLYAITSAEKGVGRQIVEAVAGATPPDWPLAIPHGLERRLLGRELGGRIASAPDSGHRANGWMRQRNAGSCPSSPTREAVHGTLTSRSECKLTTAPIRPTPEVPSARYPALTYTAGKADRRRNALFFTSVAGLLDRRGARRVLPLDLGQSRGRGCGPWNGRCAEGSLVSDRARETRRCPRRLLQPAGRGPVVAFADLCQERTGQSAGPCPKCRERDA